MILKIDPTLAKDAKRPSLRLQIGPADIREHHLRQITHYSGALQIIDANASQQEVDEVKEHLYPSKNTGVLDLGAVERLRYADCTVSRFKLSPESTPLRSITKKVNSSISLRGGYSNVIKASAGLAQDRTELTQNPQSTRYNTTL